MIYWKCYANYKVVSLNKVLLLLLLFKGSTRKCQRVGGREGGRKRETDREKEQKHRPKICHHARHCKSFIMCLFARAYFSKFNLGRESEQAPESECTSSYPSLLCKCCSRDNESKGRQKLRGAPGIWRLSPSSTSWRPRQDRPSARPPPSLSLYQLECRNTFRSFYLSWYPLGWKRHPVRLNSKRAPNIPTPPMPTHHPIHCV